MQVKVHQFKQEQFVPIPREEAWAFFSSPRNLKELTPPEMGMRVTSLPSDELYAGEIITYRVKIAPLVEMTWVTEILHVEEGLSFVDEQRAGPYQFWHHRHTFEEKDGGTLVGDLVHYAVGFGPFGEIANALFVRKQLEGIFSYRKEKLEERFG